MAAVRMKGSWWVDIGFNGARIRKRSPDNSQIGARAYEALLRQKLARGENLDSPKEKLEKACSFEEFAWKWFEEYVVPSNKNSEQRRKRYALKASLIPFFGRMTIDKISTRDIERYKAKLIKGELAGKTVNNNLTVLRKCLGAAYEWLKLGGVPPKITPLKCAPPRTDYLDEEEAMRILSDTDGVIGEMILTALRTGMRQGELKGLQWTSIDWKNRLLIVRHSLNDYTRALETPKSNKERSIPLADDLYETLLARKEKEGYVFLDVDGEPFNHKRLSRRLENVCKSLGMRRIGWHTFRHTFASHLAMRGVPLNAVQTLMGHSTIAMTARYAHVAPSTLRAAIGVLQPPQRQPDDNRLPKPTETHATQ